MTLGNTLVIALLSLLSAALSTPILHEILKTCNTLARCVAILCTLMAAWKLLTARLTAGEILVLAESMSVHFFTAETSLGHFLKAGWAFPRMTGHGTCVATFQDFLARSFAGWS